MVTKQTQRVINRSRTLTRWMYEAGVIAANIERETHEYNNVTGFLEMTTGAEIVNQSQDGGTILVQMAQDYATYIVDDYRGPRGQLSFFREYMQELQSFYDENLPSYLHEVTPAGF